MPELPEVEFGRRVAERVAAGRRIVRAVCAEDRVVFTGVAPARFSRGLRGRSVHAVHRRGKQIWFELDRRPWPVFHFGMTGAFRARDEAPLRYVSGGRLSERSSGPSSGRAGDDAWPPRFTKVRFVFDDGGELAMTNARRLGRIRLLDDPLGEPPIAGLGFDPLLDPPSPAGFRGLLAARRGTLKGLLLDQSFAAGVGNWIADEVLYRARLDPRRAPCDLDPREASRLRNALLYVVRTAVRVDADSRRFPRSWLFHHRWGREAGARTASGERIEHATIAGRTTAWVPERQH